MARGTVQLECASLICDRLADQLLQLRTAFAPYCSDCAQSVNWAQPCLVWSELHSGYVSSDRQDR